MPNYSAPLKEARFVAYGLLNYERLTALPDFSEATPELVDAVIGEAGKFAADVFAPLNQIGDTVGSKAKDGEVQTPEGFRQAYQQYIESGWHSLAQSPDFGGQGMPFTVHMMVSEYWNSANMALGVCLTLSSGAIDVLMAHASEGLKQGYLAKMISGEWTGTMNLTEPHAGSDLSNLKTKATPNGDHYLIKGQKIFITWGEHDMAENIVHIVLAPLVDAAKGVKGLSLFIVPKFLPNEDGTLGVRNDLKVVSTEHKMGINASPTCVMSFGENQGAIGYIIGKPGQGLACMFTLMNHARLEVGLEGMGIAEMAYQDALAYAKQRVQGRNPNSGDPALIIEHPDVLRLLMQMKSLTDAMRALCYDASISHDFRGHAENEAERRLHQKRFALLTPITKAWCTELVNEVTSLGIQVHGGVGYIEETGVAQYYRDARITAIYEGTNGIQANDLVGRKLIRDGGAGLQTLLGEIDASLIDVPDELANEHDRFLSARTRVQEVAEFILHNAESSANFEGAVAFNFLMQFGYVLGGWYHLRSAVIATRELKDAKADEQFLHGKRQAATFFSTQLLPRAEAYALAVLHGAQIGTELSSESFS